MKFSDLAGHARRRQCTSGALSGASPGGLARVPQLPMLGLHGRGKSVVDLGRVNLSLKASHLVNFLLGNNPAGTRVTTASTATAGPAAASTATAMSLIEGGNGAALGCNVILLGPLEVAIEVHDGDEVRELLAVRQDHGLHRVEGVFLDSLFEVMDLHFLVEVLDFIFLESGQSIVLLHVGSTVLVEVVVLAVTAVEQRLEGRDDVRVHGVDPVTPKEEGVQGPPDLAAILLGGPAGEFPANIFYPSRIPKKILARTTTKRGQLYGTKMETNVFDFTLFFSSASLFSWYDILQVPINLGSRESAFFCEIYQV